MRPLAELLELYLHAGGIRAEIYEFDYGTFRQELLDPTSGLHRFDAEFVLILPTWRDIERRPMPGNTRETIDAKIADEVAAWSNYWSAALPAGTQIIQDNFIPPPFRPLGNLDGVHDVGFSRFIRRLNDALIDAAPPSVTIHDAGRLAPAHGRWKWSDERSFYDVKLSCAPTMLPYYANSLASQLLMQRGRSKKCLALDLDNTLWGGVIGDDGVGRYRSSGSTVTVGAAQRLHLCKPIFNSTSTLSAESFSGGVHQEHRIETAREAVPRTIPRWCCRRDHIACLHRQLGRQGDQPQRAIAADPEYRNRLARLPRRQSRRARSGVRLALPRGRRARDRLTTRRTTSRLLATARLTSKPAGLSQRGHGANKPII